MKVLAALQTIRSGPFAVHHREPASTTAREGLAPCLGPVPLSGPLVCQSPLAMRSWARKNLRAERNVSRKRSQQPGRVRVSPTSPTGDLSSPCPWLYRPPLFSRCPRRQPGARLSGVEVVLRKLGKGSRAVVGRLVRAPRKGSVIVIEFPDGMHEYVTTPVKRVLRLAGREVFYIETVNSRYRLEVRGRETALAENAG